MPGLAPGIHVSRSARKAWMAGTSPAMTDLPARYPFPPEIARLVMASTARRRRSA